MYKIKLVASIAIPLLIGIFIYFAVTSGLSSRWVLLPAPSEDVFYYFSAAKMPDGFPQAISECDYSKIEFSFFSNKPRNIAECVQSRREYAEGYGRSTFVRDNEGNVWSWGFIYYSPQEVGALCWPIIFLIIGIFIMRAVKDPTKPTGQ